MPDETTRWQRTVAAPDHPRGFQARQSIERFRKDPAAPNPHALEAARDRLMLKWLALALSLTALAAWQAWHLFAAGR